MIHLVWGKELKATAEREARVMAMREVDAISDWLLLKQSLVVLTIVMVAFVLPRPLHLEPATICDGRGCRSDAARQLGASQRKGVREHPQDVRRRRMDHHLFFSSDFSSWCTASEVGGLLKLLADKLVSATGGNMAHAATPSCGRRDTLGHRGQHPVRRHHDPVDQEHGCGLRRPDKIEPLWWCLSLERLPGRQRHLIGARRT